jgi:enoyl-CoA hydratase/carnithine racemase
VRSRRSRRNHRRARVIVQSAGDVAFSAGADLGALGPFAEPAGLGRWTAQARQMLDRISDLPIPVIAAIRRPAVGGGFELALACHFRVLARDAHVALPEVRRGYLPSWGGFERLVPLVGPALALELIATGRKVSADEALARGIVHRVAADAEKGALELARELVALPRWRSRRRSARQRASRGETRAELESASSTIWSAWSDRGHGRRRARISGKARADLQRALRIRAIAVHREPAQRTCPATATSPQLASAGAFVVEHQSPGGRSPASHLAEVRNCFGLRPDHSLTPAKNAHKVAPSSSTYTWSASRIVMKPSRVPAVVQPGCAALAEHESTGSSRSPLKLPMQLCVSSLNLPANVFPCRGKITAFVKSSGWRKIGTLTSRPLAENSSPLIATSTSIGATGNDVPVIVMKQPPALGSVIGGEPPVLSLFACESSSKSQLNAVAGLVAFGLD